MKLTKCIELFILGMILFNLYASLRKFYPNAAVIKWNLITLKLKIFIKYRVYEGIFINTFNSISFSFFKLRIGRTLANLGPQMLSVQF